MSADTHLRQVSVERLVIDNQDRLGLRWIAGRDGGNRVLTGEAALKPTVGQVGHMNFIHPFRVQLLGAAEIAYLKSLSAGEHASAISRLFDGDLVAIVVANGEAMPPDLAQSCDRHHVPLLTSPQLRGKARRASEPASESGRTCSTRRR